MDATLLERARRHRWYHTLDLTPDFTTDGWFDVRPYVRHYGLPERMDGMRVLDVGTWDGFWAFEFEQRGAEVVALDLDDEAELDWQPRVRPAEFPTEPRGAGFQLAHEIRGSKVRRVVRNIYDARPDELGTFDLVFVSTVLIHLRDQFLALERMANLCHGRFIFADEYSRAAELVPFAVSRYRADRPGATVFWQPSAKTWRKLVWSAGFDDVREHGRFTMKVGEGEQRFAVRHTVIHAAARRA